MSAERMPREAFGGLSASVRQALISASTLREHARGEAVAEGGADEGNAEDALTVSSGLLALMLDDPDPRPFALFPPGTTLERVAIARDHGRWRLVALVRSNVYRTPLAALEDENEPLANWRHERAHDLLAQALDLSAALGVPDADERIVRLIRVAGTPMRVPGELGWPLTQSQLAALASLSRAHLNVRLGKLRETGRLRIDDRVARFAPAATLP